MTARSLLSILAIMSLPAAAVSRRAAHGQDDDDGDAPPDYHEPEAQQKPPEYRYPLSHKLLWCAFVAAVLAFFATSAAAVVTRLEAVEAARRPFLASGGLLEAPGAVEQDELGRVHDWEGGGGGSKGLWMKSLPRNLVDDISNLHLAANALTLGASVMVLLEFLGRCGCVGSRTPSFLHRLIISLVAAAAGFTIATHAYAAWQLAASSTFDLEVARTMPNTTISRYLVQVEYSEGRFALESWACQLKDLNQFDRNNVLGNVCVGSRTWRHWSIAAGVLAVVLLVVLVVDWRFQFFVKRRVGEKKTAEGNGIHLQALQPNASTEAMPRPELP